MGTPGTGRKKVPRDPGNDYTRDAAEARRAFLRAQTGVGLDHVSRYSFDPSVLPGNIEHFTGVAQVPIGIAGPLLVDGEHAQGEFYVPLATTEGTLVASYNRGMKTLYEAGGVKTTIVDDAMQRAPAFVFDSAREARAFGAWLTEHFAQIKQAAESTTRTGQLRGIEQYSASRILFTRFDYTTGDAAGQNLTGKATAAACAWITSRYEGITSFYLESNFATDKKSSQVNILRTRGKRVVAEVTIPAALIEEHMHTSSGKLFRARQVASLGGFMSGVNNNGLQSANGIAALFIATGQDAANVAESCAALGFSELLPGGDYYASITLPSLIVATYGGGTGLATQRECLELLGCYGTGKVLKLTEIIAATVLCGELSLGWAILAEEWVTAHDLLGRNRPLSLLGSRAHHWATGDLGPHEDRRAHAGAGEGGGEGLRQAAPRGGLPWEVAGNTCRWAARDAAALAGLEAERPPTAVQPEEIARTRQAPAPSSLPAAAARAAMAGVHPLPGVSEVRDDPSGDQRGEQAGRLCVCRAGVPDRAGAPGHRRPRLRPGRVAYGRRRASQSPRLPG